MPKRLNRRFWQRGKNSSPLYPTMPMWWAFALKANPLILCRSPNTWRKPPVKVGKSSLSLALLMVCTPLLSQLPIFAFLFPPSPFPTNSLAFYLWNPFIVPLPSQREKPITNKPLAIGQSTTSGHVWGLIFICTVGIFTHLAYSTYPAPEKNLAFFDKICYTIHKVNDDSFHIPSFQDAR